MKREDPTFVPPNTAHAGALSEFNSKFASGVSLSEKRARDDDGPIGRDAKREKQQDSDEEMELEDDDDEAAPAPKGKFACPHFFTGPEFTQVQFPRRNKPLPGYSARTCPKKLQTTSYLSCSNSAFPLFNPSAAHAPTVRWIRYRGLQSVRVVASPTPNAAGQPVKVAQILYETPQLATVAKENLDGFALKKGWVMSVSYT